jgi:hypothetical protein
MEESFLELAKVGGPAVVIVGIFVWYLWQKEKLDDVRENNHMAHNTEATDRLSEALREIAISQTKLADRIESCPKK